MSRSRGSSINSTSSDQRRRQSFGSGGGLGSNRLRLKPLTPLDRAAPLPVASPSSIGGDDYSLADWQSSRFTSAHSERSIPSSQRSASAGAATGILPSGPVDLHDTAQLGSISQASLPSYTAGQRGGPKSESVYGGDPERPQPRSRQPSISIGKFDGSEQTVVRRASATQRAAAASGGPRSFNSETFDASTDAEEYSRKRQHARRASTYARDPSAVSRRSSIVVHDDIEDPQQQQHPQQQDIQEDTLTVVQQKAQALALTTSILFKDKPLGDLWNLSTRSFKDAYAQLQTALSSISMSSREHAELTLISHDLISQLDKLFQYIISEPEFSSFWSRKMNDIQRIIEGDSRQSLFDNETSNFVLSDFIKDLAENPAYGALFLDILQTTSRFLLLLSSYKDDFFSLFTSSYEPKQEQKESNEEEKHGGDNSPVSLAIKFYDTILASLEQLTGTSLQPLILSIVTWFTIAQDVILDFADELQEFMSQTIPMSNVQDYTRHPLTGKPYSPYEAKVRLSAVVEKATLMVLEEPHKSALLKLLKHLFRAIEAVKGNSEWNRWVRSFERLWSSLNTPEADLDVWEEAIRTTLSGFVNVPLDDINGSGEEYSYSLSDLCISCSDILPEQVSIRDEFILNLGRQKHKQGQQNSNNKKRYVLDLSNISLNAQDISFAYAKKGILGVEDKGKANIQINVDLHIVFTHEKNAQGLTWPTYIDSNLSIRDCNVKFGETGKDILYQMIWPLMKNSISDSIKNVSNTWISQQLSFFFPQRIPSSTSAGPRRRRYVIPSSLLESQQISASTAAAAAASQASPRVGTTMHHARDAFRRDIQKFTSLPTNVLDGLENPFSNVSSNAPTELGEETQHYQDGTTGTSAKPKRRKSMAEYLTNESSKDATLEQNITSPPTATSAARHEISAAAGKEQDYENMASCLSSISTHDMTTADNIKIPPVDPTNSVNNVMSHRGSGPKLSRKSFTSSGEMSYDQYEQAIADDDEEADREQTMARSLSELATRDATTLDAIEKPPVAPFKGPDIPSGDASSSTRANRPSMSKVTRDLSGLPDSDMINGDHSSFQRSASTLDHPSTVPYQPRPRAMSVHSSYSQPVAAPPTRRPSMKMSDCLDDICKEDYTAPEAQAKMHRSPSRSSQTTDTGFSKNELLQRRKSMSLNDEATKDATLPQNFTSPLPGTDSSNNQLKYSRSRRSSAASSSGLDQRDVLPMASTLTDDLEKDYTTPEAQSEYYRPHGRRDSQHSSSSRETPGLDREQLRRRSMSSALSDTAKADMTLYNNVCSPPLAADAHFKPKEEEQKPNPLQRRPSTVIH